MDNTIQAIVYTSNTGHTKEYAELIGEAAKLPVYELGQAKRMLSKGLQILYLGWIRTGKIKGYDKAASRFLPRAVCGVGLMGNRAQVPELRRANRIPDDVAVFALRGGLEMDKLKGLDRLLMDGIRKQVIETLSKQESRDEEETEMLSLLQNGGSEVSRKHLYDVISWIAHSTPERPGQRDLEERLMKRSYFSPEENRSEDASEYERRKQAEITRRRLAQLDLTPEQVDRMKAEAIARNTLKGHYQRDPNAPTGSPDNPVEAGMAGACDSLYFDLDKGYWILTDGPGSGWIR